MGQAWFLRAGLKARQALKKFGIGARSISAIGRCTGRHVIFHLRGPRRLTSAPMQQFEDIILLIRFGLVILPRYEPLRRLEFEPIGPGVQSAESSRVRRVVFVNGGARNKLVRSQILGPVYAPWALRAVG